MKTNRKEISGYEGKYFITREGKVYSKYKNRFLKPRKLNNGYLMVTLCIDGRQDQISVHRLVAEAFIPNPKNKPCVNHKNFIRNDNRAQNLEWSTYGENVRYSAKRGRLSHSDSHHNSKLTKKSVVECREKYKKGKSIKQMAFEASVSYSTMQRAIAGKTWKH